MTASELIAFLEREVVAKHGPDRTVSFLGTSGAPDACGMWRTVDAPFVHSDGPYVSQIYLQRWERVP